MQVRDQWFVKMKPLAEPALEAVANGELRIVPDRFEKVYNRWLHNIRVRCGSTGHHITRHIMHHIMHVVLRSSINLALYQIEIPYRRSEHGGALPLHIASYTIADLVLHHFSLEKQSVRCCCTACAIWHSIMRCKPALHHILIFSFKHKFTSHAAFARA